MTKEEAIKIVLQLDVDEYNIPTQFADRLHQAFSRLAEELCKPSPPSDVDEAAEEYADKYPTCGLAKHSFKAGAEWMAGQGVTLESEIVREGLPPSELLDKAINYIIDLIDGQDTICNKIDGNWCSKHCDNLTPDRQCVLKYLKEVYKKK